MSIGYLPTHYDDSITKLYQANYENGPEWYRQKLSNLLSDKTLSTSELKERIAQLNQELIDKMALGLGPTPGLSIVQSGTPSGSPAQSTPKIPLLWWLLVALAVAIGAWYTFAPRKAASS